MASLGILLSGLRLKSEPSSFQIAETENWAGLLSVAVKWPILAELTALLFCSPTVPAPAPAAVVVSLAVGARVGRIAFTGGGAAFLFLFSIQIWAGVVLAFSERCDSAAPRIGHPFLSTPGGGVRT